eukprot:15434622-Alexandrium_andersonii.AAC.1
MRALQAQELASRQTPQPPAWPTAGRMLSGMAGWAAKRTPLACNSTGGPEPQATQRGPQHAL